MGCAIGTAKYLVFFFNFIFFISGILIITIGAIALSEEKNISKTTEVSFHAIPIVVIVVGVIVGFIAFLGCCGAIKSNYCMLISFSVILGIIFIIELSAGIAAYVERGKLEDQVRNGLKKTIAKTQDNDTMEAWNGIQHEFTCCGVNNASDWGAVIPPSCCKYVDDKPPVTCTLAEALTRKGCVDELKSQLEKNVVLLGGIGIGISFIQIMGIVCACCLASAVKGSY